MSRDPFYSVKDKVQNLLTKLRTDFSRLETLSTRSADFSSLTASLRTQLSTIEVDVNDLAQTIVIVEQNRQRFPSISQQELDGRKGFVNETKSTLSNYADTLKRLQQKAANEQRKALMDSTSSSSRFSSAASSSHGKESDDYVNNASSQQAQLYKQQDVVLDDMDAALARLGNISNDINSELVEQDAMLNEMDAEMDDAQGNMNVVLKKMDKLLKSSDKGRICCIIGLFCLCLLLLFLIIG